MAKLNSSINSILSEMRKTGGTGKGSIGEQAVFSICEEFYQKQGGILIHSYSYKTDPTVAGNIKRTEDGKLFIENLGTETEIDVLYISKYRMFPIEVKAYKANEIKIDDAGIYGCYKTDKSPVHQNEMHCRHYYSHMFRAFTDGSTEFIVPIVCMVDRAKIIDERSAWQKEYIKLTTLNNLKEVIEMNNTPIGYQLNLTLVDRILKEAMVSNTKYLPPRV